VIACSFALLKRANARTLFATEQSLFFCSLQKSDRSFKKSDRSFTLSKRAKNERFSKSLIFCSKKKSDRSFSNTVARYIWDLAATCQKSCRYFPSFQRYFWATNTVYPYQSNVFIFSYCFLIFFLSKYCSTARYRYCSEFRAGSKHPFLFHLV